MAAYAFILSSRVCVFARARACTSLYVRACVRACVRVCVCVRACVHVVCVEC